MGTATLPTPPAKTKLATSDTVAVNAATLKHSSVMIVDDEPVNVKILKKYLTGAGYENFITTSDSTEALPLIVDRQPDVILLDVMMPDVNGLEILEAIRSKLDMQHTPVLILTAASDKDTKMTALMLGATDFLPKPVDPSELALRVRNALIVKAHQTHLENYSTMLEDQVRQRTIELQDSRREVIHVLACAAEYRDHETGNHVIRVGLYASAIAQQLGLPSDQVALLEQAAVLHDVGKIGIPDSILLKPAKLDDGEKAMMQNHCDYGLNILRGIPANRDTAIPGQESPYLSSQSPILQMAATISISHHEKWDGTGYPIGLSEDLIPIEGRITAVADVYDALSSDRPYKKAFSWDKCCQILEEGRGTHFDPAVLDAFFIRQDEILNIRNEYADVVVG